VATAIGLAGYTTTATAVITSGVAFGTAGVLFGISGGGLVDNKKGKRALYILGGIAGACGLIDGVSAIRLTLKAENSASAPAHEEGGDVPASDEGGDVPASDEGGDVPVSEEGGDAPPSGEMEIDSSRIDNSPDYCDFMVSFIPGTKISSRSGFKNIEDMQLKEKIWGYNEKTRQTDLFPVTAKSVKLHHDSVALRTESGNTIGTTTEHPFYVEGRGWIPAGKLKQGDAIRTQDGTSVLLESVTVEYVEDAFPAYNLSVDKAHNFFVSEDKLLVHNCGREEDAAEGEEGAGETAGESAADEGVGSASAAASGEEGVGMGVAEVAGAAEVEALPEEIEIGVEVALLLAL
ncbi:polymorphic toxin-type HINT domain-containing protein, partial [Moorena sp. SIO4E2]|uniref:polymorphic toxin-type HINT domain-containing protein n=1 Tax=Moorena sp. SIO4E2 TaxID=2607826 RepID=UPI00257971A5